MNGPCKKLQEQQHPCKNFKNQLEDVHIWRHEASGLFSKSVYKAFFRGSINFEPWKRLWRSWAPPKCNTFLWLAIRNKCWTADRLEKRAFSPRGLPPLRSRAGNSPTHPNELCFCKAFLAQHYGYLRYGSPHPESEWTYPLQICGEKWATMCIKRKKRNKQCYYLGGLVHLAAKKSYGFWRRFAGC